jgi:hypothetical protein
MGSDGGEGGTPRLCEALGGIRIGAYDSIQSHHALRACEIIDLFVQKKFAQMIVLEHFVKNNNFKPPSYQQAGLPPTKIAFSF